mgnify:FL=1
MRQAQVRTERNKGTRTRVKTFMKKVEELSKTKPEEAEKLLPVAYKHIDTAAKKNQLHKKTAARRKSRLARTVAVAKAGKKK